MASAADVLTERGHTVVFMKDVLPINAKDPEVARASEINGCILVSQDGDFKKIVKRIPDGAKTAIRRLSRITLQCKSPRCAKRLALAMVFIESEWEVAQSSSDPRMFLVIGDNAMRTSR